MAEPNVPDLTGTRIGEYEIISRLGVGGMGVVYEGRQPVIGKRVAVKVLLPLLSYDKELVERFVSEARAVNEIGHRGIVDIFSFGQLESGQHYFVMEYLDGQPFDRLVKTRSPVLPEEVLWWSEEICEALQAAHDAGIIHRDIKPSNLFLVDNGRGRPYVKLLDFGIAKLGAKLGESTPQTRASMVVGTPDYMSPEQARGKAITPAVDVYALGCVMFELLTGKRAFKGENPLETMFMHVENAPPKVRDFLPGLPVELEELLLWTMEKDPLVRPNTAEELRLHIAELRKALPEVVMAPRPSPSRRDLPSLSPSGRQLPVSATPRPPSSGPRRSATSGVRPPSGPSVRIGSGPHPVTPEQTQSPTMSLPRKDAVAIPVELSFTGEHGKLPQQGVALGEEAPPPSQAQRPGAAGLPVFVPAPANVPEQQAAAVHARAAGLPVFVPAAASVAQQQVFAVDVPGFAPAAARVPEQQGSAVPARAAELPVFVPAPARVPEPQAAAAQARGSELPVFMPAPARVPEPQAAAAQARGSELPMFMPAPARVPEQQAAAVQPRGSELPVSMPAPASVAQAAVGQSPGGGQQAVEEQAQVASSPAPVRLPMFGQAPVGAPLAAVLAAVRQRAAAGEDVSSLAPFEAPPRSEEQDIAEVPVEQPEAAAALADPYATEELPLEPEPAPASVDPYATEELPPEPKPAPVVKKAWTPPPEDLDDDEFDENGMPRRSKTVRNVLIVGAVALALAGAFALRGPSKPKEAPVDPGVQVQPPAEVKPPPVLEPMPAKVTGELLKARIAKFDADLKVQEAAAGDANDLARQLSIKAKADLAKANTEAKRRDLWDFLDEMQNQLGKR